MDLQRLQALETYLTAKQNRKNEEFEKLKLDYNAQIQGREAALEDARQRIDRLHWMAHLNEMSQEAERRVAPEFPPYADLWPFLNALIEEYLSSSETERAKIRETISMTKTLRRCFLDYAFQTYRNLPTQEGLRRALALISIEDKSVDYRNTILAVDRLLELAKEAGLAYQAVFEEAAGMASITDDDGIGSMQKFLMHYTNR